MRVQEKLSLFFILFLSFSQRLQSNVYFLTRSPLFEFSHCHSLSIFLALSHSAHTHSLSLSHTLTLAHMLKHLHLEEIWVKQSEEQESASVAPTLKEKNVLA